MRRHVVRIVVAVALLAGGAAVSPVVAADTPPPTVVTLTFDDGHASHQAVGELLASKLMAGTFYVNSGKIQSSAYYLSWPQLRTLDAAHEIGGHTVDHVRLGRLSAAEAERQICQDRSNLIGERITTPTAFAYPNGDVSAETLVQKCGYTTGRALGGLKTGTTCRACPSGETIPPTKPFALRTLRHVTVGNTAAELQGYVAEAVGNGAPWVVLLFHGICNDRCTGTYSFRLSEFEKLVGWLESEVVAGRIVVRTVEQVMDHA